MATISFDLVSPENLVFNDEVGTIIVPGKDGDLGILPGHSKVMSSLRPGTVSYTHLTLPTILLV